MATLLIELPKILMLILLAAAIAGVYLALRKRTAASRIRVLVISSVCMLVVMWGFGLLGGRRGSATHRTAANSATAAAHPSARTGNFVTASSRPLEAPQAVYGHSVVKGGIHTLGELLNVIATDPLAAEHYKGFDISRAHFIRLDHNIMAYVSYRVDGKGIYWTSKPELIMAGEEVITDGTNFIRVRCGNMISYSPQSPAETDSPTDTDTIVETFTPFSDTPLGANVGIPPSGNPGGGNPPPGCCSSGGYNPPPIFTTPTVPYTPGGPGNPPPNTTTTISADEFNGHEALYTLIFGIFVLFLVVRARS
jgi:hypothetical protein